VLPTIVTNQALEAGRLNPPKVFEFPQRFLLFAEGFSTSGCGPRECNAPRGSEPLDASPRIRR